MPKHTLAQLRKDAKRDGWLDQIRTENDERALFVGHYFDRGAAEFVCEFFRRFLRHSEDTAAVRAGDRFELLPWQRDDVVYPLYGWKKPNGLRRFRRAYVSAAKKNGKSTLTGGLGICHLIADRERNAEVYVAAAEREQAAIVYRQAAKMVAASPALRRKIETVDSRKTLRVIGGNDFLRALSAESSTKEGLNWSCLIFDELHAQRDSRLWDALVYGGRARRQPLLIVITTAGNTLDGICYEQYRYAKGVRDGDIEDLSYLTCIAEAEPDCVITDPVAHRAANPSLGVIFTADSLAEEAERAKASSTEETKFRRYSLNQWVNVAGGWLPLDGWDRCGDTVVDWESLDGAEVFAGLDLSSKLDMTAFVLVAPYEDGFAVKPCYFAPRDRADELARKGNYSYQNWAKRGYLTLTEGGVTDYAAVIKCILEAADTYKLISVAVDPWNAGDITNQITAEGITVVEVPQNVKRLSEPAKSFEAYVKTGRVFHNGHPVLRWNASNVCVRYDTNENILPQKPRKGGPELIDGIAATINAFSEIKRVEQAARTGALSFGEFMDRFGGVLDL